MTGFCVRLKRPPIKEVISQVAEKHGILVSDLMGKSHRRDFAWPRFELYVLLRQRGWSYPKIGQFMGRAHTSILYGVRRWHEIHKNDCEGMI